MENDVRVCKLGQIDSTIIVLCVRDRAESERRQRLHTTLNWHIINYFMFKNPFRTSRVLCLYQLVLHFHSSILWWMASCATMPPLCHCDARSVQFDVFYTRRTVNISSWADCLPMTVSYWFMAEKHKINKISKIYGFLMWNRTRCSSSLSLSHAPT